ncbi:MAG: hypothetical protein ACYDBP_15585 [Leptospirales bacterium]
MTSNASFRITYGGPALETHEMDARDLAGALFALGDLCTAAGNVLYGDTAKIEVKVKASFKESSFGIDLVLLHNWITSLIDMLNGKDAVASATALTFLDYLGLRPEGGLVGFLRRVRGRKAISVEDGEEGTKIVTLSDGEKLEEKKEIVELYRDVATRRELSKILEPLDRDGINEFRVGRDGNDMSISKEEYPYFRYIPGDESLLENEYEMRFEIVSPVFQKGLKWKLSDGNSTFHADILDENFWKDVEKGNESFSIKDILICRARLVQSMQDDKLKARYQILKVIEHLKTLKPQKLPFENPE